MARSRKRSAGRPKAARPAPAKKEKKPRVEVEIVEAEEGPGWETGVAVLTGILILVSLLMVDYDLGKSGAGIFF